VRMRMSLPLPFIRRGYQRVFLSNPRACVFLRGGVVGQVHLDASGQLVEQLCAATALQKRARIGLP
jgi:hypothetical protein